MNKTLLAIAAATTLALPAAPAMADGGPPSWAPANGYYENDRGDRYDRHDRYDRRQDRRSRNHRRARHREYDDHGRYYEPRQVRRGDRVWRGRDGRYHLSLIHI